jgi:putative SOS response-associated peptidase YedK
MRDSAIGVECICATPSADPWSSRSLTEYGRPVIAGSIVWHLRLCGWEFRLGREAVGHGTGKGGDDTEMCGRVIQASGPLRLAIVDGLDVRDRRITNVPRRYNAAPSQDLLVIRQNHRTRERSLDLLKWGLIPYWCSDPKGGRKPINAKAETIAKLPTFREAYARRRCILPVDGFFEWKAIKGQRARQPFAIAMKDGSPFGIACLWENWKDLSGEWVRTFTIVTVPANELVGTIHDRKPAILHREDYDRWLGIEPDPHDALRPFPSERLRMRSPRG